MKRRGIEEADLVFDKIVGSSVLDVVMKYDAEKNLDLVTTRAVQELFRLITPSGKNICMSI